MIESGKIEEGKVEEVKLPPTRDRVIKKLSDALEALRLAHLIAINAHSLANDLPVFQRIQMLQKEISSVMIDVNKLRGL